MNQQSKLVNSIKNRSPIWSESNNCASYSISVFADATGLLAAAVEPNTGYYLPIPSTLKTAISYRVFY